MIWKSIQLVIGATPDGIPGPETGAAIAEKLNLPSGDWKSIQRVLGISPDGIPGDDTARAVADELGIDPEAPPWMYSSRAILGFSYEIIPSEKSLKSRSGTCFQLLHD